MGTDIHLYVEVLTDGEWALVWPELIVDRDDIEELAKRRGLSYEAAKRIFPGRVAGLGDPTWSERLNAKWDSPLYPGRNYNLFTILAGVRNGRGFAGCKTGDGFNVIGGRVRGLPLDVSRQVRWEAERWVSDGHSHSHHLLRHLQEFDWDQQTKLSGVVGPFGFHEWRTQGQPSSWAGDVRGPSIEHVSNEEMAKRVDALGPAGPQPGPVPHMHDLGATVYTRVEWGVTYRQAVGSEWLDQWLAALAELGPSSDVRIVFWFDN